MLLAVLALVFATAAATGLLVVGSGGEDGAIARRVGQITRNGRAAPRAALDDDEELRLPFSQRVMAPMLESLAGYITRFAPGALHAKVRGRLVQAGRPLEPTRYLGLRAVFAVGLLLFMSTLVVGGEKNFIGAALLLLSPLLGWHLPEVWLGRLIAERKKGIERALPDVLDLLSVSVEAGLGFDGAVQKVSEKFPDPMAAEMRAFLKEVRLGKSRAEALRSLADRTGVSDLQSFVAALIQADQLGVPIGKVLRAQSEAMRLKRKQRAQERAMQLPLKMLFPLIFFIFPTIFVVVMGPAVIQIMDTFLK